MTEKTSWTEPRRLMPPVRLYGDSIDGVRGVGSASEGIFRFCCRHLTLR